MRRPLRVRPLAQILTIRTEDLNAIAFAVADINASFGINRDAVRKIELSRPLARLAPRSLQLAFRREDMDAGVAVSVADVDVAVGPDSDIRRTVERPGGALDARDVLAVVAGIRWRVEDAHGHEQLALGRVLTNSVIAVVCAEDAAIRGDVDAVRAIRKLAFAP